MNGLLLVNKPKGYTSRDIVNIVGKSLNTRKIGHTGTLDPIATGVLVLCIGNHLKVAELLTKESKEYIARVILGIETDTLDIEGKILKEENNTSITKEQIEKVLKTFIGKQKQQVPKYSAIKINGKKLYEYARNNIEIELPVRDIEIKNIELLDKPEVINNHIEFTIKCHVSKGTYIRSLIRDIGIKLNTYATMKELNRIKQGDISIENTYTIEQIKDNNYKLLNIKDILNIEKVIVDNNLLFKIKNGQILDKFFKSDKALILDKEENIIAIYKEYEKDNKKVKPWKMF